ncbi:MAG: ArsR/SmtB family transcription factor [Gemmatimonadaceae bacterium]
MPNSALLEQLPALVDPTRARLLYILAQQELTVGELCTVSQLPQSTVSRQLRTLSDEGWVASRAEGTSRYYRMNPDLGDSAKQLWDLVSADLADGVHATADAERVRAVLAKRRARSREFFAGAASEWETIRESVFGERASLVGMLGLLDGGWTVGDLGCGTAHLTRLLAPFVHRVIGVDASPAMLERARVSTNDFANVELRTGELEKLPLEDGTLDAAILALVLHNVADPAAVLREAGRALRAGGRLLVLDVMPHSREDLRQRMGHVWQGFSADQLMNWMRQANCPHTRYIALPPDLTAEVPALFVATASRGLSS